MSTNKTGANPLPPPPPPPTHFSPDHILFSKHKSCFHIKKKSAKPDLNGQLSLQQVCV